MISPKNKRPPNLKKAHLDGIITIRNAHTHGRKTIGGQRWGGGSITALFWAYSSSFVKRTGASGAEKTTGRSKVGKHWGKDSWVVCRDQWVMHTRKGKKFGGRNSGEITGERRDWRFIIVRSSMD